MEKSLYSKLEIDREMCSQKQEGKLYGICEKIEKEIVKSNRDGKTYLSYQVDEYTYNDYGSNIIKYFIDKKIYCKSHPIFNDEDGYYSIEFYWDKTIEEYIKDERIETCLKVIIIILLFLFFSLYPLFN